MEEEELIKTPIQDLDESVSMDADDLFLKLDEVLQNSQKVKLSDIANFCQALQIITSLEQSAITNDELTNIDGSEISISKIGNYLIEIGCFAEINFDSSADPSTAGCSLFMALISSEGEGEQLLADDLPVSLSPAASGLNKWIGSIHRKIKVNDLGVGTVNIASKVVVNGSLPTITNINIYDAYIKVQRLF